MILAVIQARMSSTRLPGKVLKECVAMPLLVLQLERVKQAKQVDQIVVATSTQESDTPLAQAGQQYGFEVFRGSLDNVLDRFYHAAMPFAPVHVVRLTADCPLSDPHLIDQAIACHLQHKADYTSNNSGGNRVVPDGFDVEVMTAQALEIAWTQATTPYQTEHVTPYLYQNPSLFRCVHVPGQTELGQYRLTVDYPEDFEVVTTLLKSFYPNHLTVTMEECVSFLNAHPDCRALNQKFV